MSTSMRLRKDKLKNQIMELKDEILYFSGKTPELMQTKAKYHKKKFTKKFKRMKKEHLESILKELRALLHSL